MGVFLKAFYELATGSYGQGMRRLSPPATGLVHVPEDMLAESWDVLSDHHYDPAPVHQSLIKLELQVAAIGATP